MTDTKDDLIERLMAYANDPMWANHAEVPKRLLVEAARALRASAGREMECATQDCGKPATVHFERGGVGSHYCHDCYMRVQAIAAPTQGGSE